MVHNIRCNFWLAVCANVFTLCSLELYQTLLSFYCNLFTNRYPLFNIQIKTQILSLCIQIAMEVTFVILFVCMAYWTHMLYHVQFAWAQGDFNFRGTVNFCPKGQRDLRNSQKRCPNFLLFFQKSCTNETYIYPTEGGCSPLHYPFSYTYENSQREKKALISIMSLVIEKFIGTS